MADGSVTEAWVFTSWGQACCPTATSPTHKIMVRHGRFSSHITFDSMMIKNGRFFFIPLCILVTYCILPSFFCSSSYSFLTPLVPFISLCSSSCFCLLSAFLFLFLPFLCVPSLFPTFSLCSSSFPHLPIVFLLLFHPSLCVPPLFPTFSLYSFSCSFHFSVFFFLFLPSLCVPHLVPSISLCSSSCSFLLFKFLLLFLPFLCVLLLVPSSSKSSFSYLFLPSLFFKKTLKSSTERCGFLNLFFGKLLWGIVHAKWNAAASPYQILLTLSSIKYGSAEYTVCLNIFAGAGIWQYLSKFYQITYT